jgi:DNA topoisomerase-1
VQHNKTYANIEAGDDVLTIGQNRAVTLIAEKIAKGPRASRFSPAPGRPLGEHPDKGGPIVVKSGRYGPYVSHDGVNASLPSDKTPETVTLEEAVSLIDARSSDGRPPAQRRRPARGATAAKAKSRAKPAPAPGRAKPAAASGRAKPAAASGRAKPAAAPGRAKPAAAAAKKPSRKAKAAN